MTGRAALKRIVQRSGEGYIQHLERHREGGPKYTVTPQYTVSIREPYANLRWGRENVYGGGHRWGVVYGGAFTLGS